MPPRTKNISGKRYHLNDTFRLKSSAQSRAKQLRSQKGSTVRIKSVRVVSIAEPNSNWAVYIR